MYTTHWEKRGITKKEWERLPIDEILKDIRENGYLGLFNAYNEAIASGAQYNRDNNSWEEK